MDHNDPEYYTVIGYYYQPIPHYGGQVLKHAGLACPGNREHMMAKPGMLMLDEYKGDRIRADDHSLFTDC